MSEETLFHEALGQPPPDRAAFLDAACAGQPDLRAAVEALLAAHEASGSLLDRPPVALAQTVDSGPAPAEPAPPPFVSTADYHPHLEPGVVIAARYVLQEKIGEGGMGEVWVAEQTEPVKRRVALKLIKTGMDSRAVLQRFEAERQALALMDHPHIARVLDGGLTPTGQPFFVMELVNGLPLTKFCDEARLTPRERLELFVPICQAVQHAHHKGIVHRDLKPANILVTRIDGRAVPKVIDFGVAKATAGKLTDASLATQFGAVIGTLEYMAPEQAGYSGEDIDTRADVYSLGVILYELLTGLRPIDAKRLRQAALTEMIRILREEEPSRPSTRLSTDEALPSLAALRQTEPRRLIGLLRGELDWVVLKCLEKQRERRYETANGLVRDVQRYLADEPVEARPPSAGYRLGKFLKRHKGPVLAASLVLLALLGGIAGTTLGLLRAEQRRGEADKARGREAERAEGERRARQREAEQRAKAEKARNRARDALDAMTSSVTGDSLTTQKAISAEQKQFLSEVLSYYQEFAGEQADDEPSRARTARAAFRVGTIESRLGREAEGATAFRQARDGYDKLAADFPAVPAYRLGLASSHHNLGNLLSGLGQWREAEQQFRQAVALHEKLAADFPTVPGYRRDLAGSHNSLGSVLKLMEKGPEAEREYRQALAIQKKLAADFPAVAEFRHGLATTHTNLGALLRERGKGSDAEQQYRQALAIQEQLAADFPVPALGHEWAKSLLNLGNLLSNLGQGPEAEKQFRRALAISGKLSADFPAVPAYRQHQARSHNNLGNLLSSLGRWPEADRQHQRALALCEKLVADSPTVPEYRRDLAFSHTRLGALLQRLGKGPEAERQVRRTVVLCEKLAADSPTVSEYRRDLANKYHQLGLVLADLGKRPEAEKQYRRAVALCEKLAAGFPTVPAYREGLARNHQSLGLVLTRQGKGPEAERQLRRALAILEKLAADFPAMPRHGHDLARSHVNLGNALSDLRKRAQAEKQYRQARAIFENLVADFPTVPQYRQDLARSHNNLGNMLAVPGKEPQAEKQYRQALAICVKLAADFPALPEYRQELANNHSRLGKLLLALKRRTEAEKQYRQALALQEKLVADFSAVPPYQIDLGGSYCNFGSLLIATGQPRESLPWLEKAIRTLTAAHQQDRPLAQAKQFLRNSHQNRALAYDHLKKYAEAISDWARASELTPENEQRAYRATLANDCNLLGIQLRSRNKLPEAEKAYRQAFAIQQKLAAEFPDEPQYQLALGGITCNLGNLARARGRLEEAPPWYEKAIRILTAVYEQDRASPQARLFLHNSHWGRAQAYQGLKKYAESLEDWDRAVELSPKAKQTGMRAARATAQSKGGRVAEAVAGVTELAKLPGWNAGQLYDFACVCAVASGKSADRKQEYADRAMELLHQAVKAGWKDAAHMKKDTDLDPLRGRQDFQRLIQQFEKTTGARPEKKS